jgi:hypothetical protein
MYHTLGDELSKRLGFVGGGISGGPERGAGEEFGDEARIEEVEDCVLDATDVDIYRKGGVGGFR